jgi:hypothetical protein
MPKRQRESTQSNNPEFGVCYFTDYDLYNESDFEIATHIVYKIGDIINGNFTGKSKFIFGNNYVYEGSIVNSLPHGKGKITGPNYVYDGDFMKGSKNGQGVETFNLEWKYMGKFKDGHFHDNTGEYFIYNKIVTYKDGYSIIDPVEKFWYCGNFDSGVMIKECKFIAQNCTFKGNITENKFPTLLFDSVDQKIISSSKEEIIFDGKIIKENIMICGTFNISHQNYLISNIKCIKSQLKIYFNNQLCFDFVRTDDYSTNKFNKIILKNKDELCFGDEINVQIVLNDLDINVDEFNLFHCDLNDEVIYYYCKSGQINYSDNLRGLNFIGEFSGHRYDFILESGNLTQNNNIFEGIFDDKSQYLKGILKSGKDEMYIGNFHDGNYFLGLLATNSDDSNIKITYIGEFKNNVYDGFGILIYSDGSEYKGQFKNGFPFGRIEYKYKSDTDRESIISKKYIYNETGFELSEILIEETNKYKIIKISYLQRKNVDVYIFQDIITKEKYLQLISENKLIKSYKLEHDYTLAEICNIFPIPNLNISNSSDSSNSSDLSEDLMICPTLLSPIICPVRLTCDHIFCHYSLTLLNYNDKKNNYICPLCRQISKNIFRLYDKKNILKLCIYDIDGKKINNVEELYDFIVVYNSFQDLYKEDNDNLERIKSQVQIYIEEIQLERINQLE